ncbi:MAG: ribonuclease Z [Patescibacteria group bacterium]
MGLQIIALGTGVCYDSPKEKILRQPPGFLVIVDDLHLLFDCSEGIRFRLHQARVDLSRVTHVAVSHAHPDHAALPQFIQAKFCRYLFGEHDDRAAKLKIFMAKILVRDFPQVWNWHQPENDGGYWKEFEPEFVGMEDGYKEKLADGVTFTAKNMYHGYGRHPSMGFRLETPYGTVAYTGDTGVCEGLSVISKDADLLIAECSARVGQEYSGGYGHLGPRQCGDLALKGRVKTMWLTHYYDFDSPDVMLAEVRAAGYFGEAKLAQDGDRWSS